MTQAAVQRCTTVDRWVRLFVMTGRLGDKVAIVTGGGDGIGRGIVRRFAQEGAHVLVAEIDEASGDEVARACGAEFGADVRFRHTDASQKADVADMVAAALDAWGTVDVLVNNAWGGGTLGRFEHTTDEQLQWGLSMGLLGPFWGMQAVLPVMKAKRHGAVINMCSLNGVNAHMGTAQYNIAKEALRSASRTAAREWAPWQIRVNVICPGAKTAASRAASPHTPSSRPPPTRPTRWVGSAIPSRTSRRWRCSWPVTTRATSPGTRCSWTAGATSTASPGPPISGNDRRASGRGCPGVTAADRVTAALQGMTAVVAGTGPGIGAASARALRRAGADVVVAARDRVRLESLAAEIADGPGGRVEPLVADLGDLGSCRALVDQTVSRLGRLDVLVNVATDGGAHATIDEADWASWRAAFEVNVVGTLELSRLAARIMRAQGGGSIIQVGTFGTHALPEARARYTATKQAMVTASLTLAKELGPANVRVNVVTPGFVAGQPLDAMVASIAARSGRGTAEVSARMAAGAALRRHVEPEDVADAVVFLAGPGARAITGVELPVTAGR
jgi:NAD(P)-dependent dehydrogenase (short-subunit alcohol dehydrogenase family)